MSSREDAVAGMFYPNSCNEIQQHINHFNKIVEDANYNPDVNFTPKAMISPHAGYVYSGFTANLAFQTAIKNNQNIKRVIVIGPSHKVYLNGASIALYDDYKTPCGNLAIDLEYSEKLLEQFNFIEFLPEVHKEHSTETQMPFIQHYFNDIKIVELVYGNIDFEDVSTLIDAVLEDDANFIVISTDLSHFYTQNQAKKLDSICLEAIDKLNLDIITQGCEACGIIGVKAIINSAIKKSFKSKILDYRTSYDASGDDTRVVGYTSALLGD